MSSAITRRNFIKTFTSGIVGIGTLSLFGCTLSESPRPWQPFQYGFVPNSESGDLSVIDTLSKEEIERIDVGERPHYVDVSPDGKLALVTNGESDTVTIINTQTLTEVKTLRVDHHPCWIEVRPDNQFAYVGNSGSDTVSVIDMERLEVIANIPTGKHPEWLHTVQTPDGAWRCYAANGRDTTLSQITGPPFDSAKSFGAEKWPQWATPSRDGRTIFATNHESASVTVHDTVTGALLKTLPAGDAPDYAVPSPDNKYMLVSNRRSHEMTAIDIQSLDVLATIPVDLVPGWIDYSSDSSRAFVVNEFGNSLSVINTATWEEIKQVPTPRLPIWVDVQPDSIYVVCRNNNSVNMLDPDTLEYQNEIEVGERPLQLTIFPQAIQFVRS